MFAILFKLTQGERRKQVGVMQSTKAGVVSVHRGCLLLLALAPRLIVTLTVPETVRALGEQSSVIAQNYSA